MSPEEFKSKMEELHDEHSHDPEGFHLRADEFTCQVLTQLGFTEGVEIFVAARKWYA